MPELNGIIRGSWILLLAALAWNWLLPVQAAPPVESFVVGQQVRSSQPPLQNVALTLRSAELTGDTLLLNVAFENISSRKFSITGEVNKQYARLVDAAGNVNQPLEMSQNLASVSPEGGFAPGAANPGQLVFPRPTGGEPYELQFLTYEPIRFRLDTPLVEMPPVVVPPGNYPLDASLYSAQNALTPVELQLRSVQVTTDTLTFTVAFVNTSRQGYDLLVGPGGSDAWLLDAEGRQFSPVAVSESIRDAIDPAEGWQPGQAHPGAITFPRPEAMAEVRFVFPEYNGLTLYFDTLGLARTQVTSPSGGEALAIPTPAPENRLFVDLNQRLADQAAALLAGETVAYLDFFTPEQRPAQQEILTRTAQLPLVSYSLAVASGADLVEDTPGRLEAVEVQVRYTLAGLPANNPFLHTVRYNFTRQGDTWLVSGTSPGTQPPFWWMGGVLFRETEHFLIFARPEVVDQLPALAAETEAAYQALAGRGLPLAPRYATYFSATQADFQELTGQPARVVGAAAWRYNLGEDKIDVSSRAFYLNGEAFTGQHPAGSDNDRQLTILHELVHLVLAAETRPFTPPWLTEGIAVYFAGQNTPAARRRLLDSLDSLSMPALTQASTLNGHGPAGVLTTDEYAYSGEVIRYLAETFGEDQVLAFYSSYTILPAGQLRAEVPPLSLGPQGMDAAFSGLSDQVTADSVQQFFGRTLAELDGDVKIWLRRQG